MSAEASCSDGRDLHQSVAAGENLSAAVLEVVVEVEGMTGRKGVEEEAKLMVPRIPENRFVAAA